MKNMCCILCIFPHTLTVENVAASIEQTLYLSACPSWLFYINQQAGTVDCRTPLFADGEKTPSFSLVLLYAMQHQGEYEMRLPSTL